MKETRLRGKKNVRWKRKPRCEVVDKKEREREESKIIRRNKERSDRYSIPAKCKGEKKEISKRD